MTLDFREIPNGFYIEIIYSIQKTVSEVGDRVGDTLTKNQMDILLRIKELNTISARELADKIGISQRKIEENIFKLKKMKIIERIGSAKSGYWKIIE